MKAALYARISTTEKRQHLETQLAQLRRYCASRRWKIAGEYTDADSGAAESRPGIDRLMADAARKTFDIVVVFELSRLTRRGPAHTFQLVERLKSSGVEFWSVTQEHFRTTGPAGSLFLAIAAYLAEEERRLLQDRIKAGLERARKAGVKLGRPKIRPNFRRGEMAGLRAEGWSLRRLARRYHTTRSTIERRLKDAEEKRWHQPAWTCPDPRCQTINMAVRTHCRNCKRLRYLEGEQP